MIFRLLLAPMRQLAQCRVKKIALYLSKLFGNVTSNNFGFLSRTLTRQNIENIGSRSGKRH